MKNFIRLYVDTDDLYGCWFTIIYYFFKEYGLTKEEIIQVLKNTIEEFDMRLVFEIKPLN